MNPKEYYVASSLNHNNRQYGRGQMVTLDPEAIGTQVLLEDGIISETPVSAREPLAAPEAPQAAEQPKIGGAPMETGEPSLDGRGEPGAEGQTKDITPEVSEKMTRPELEALAREKGLADAEIEAAPNKGALVEMIVGGTTPTPEADAEPAIDPSANL